MMLNLSNAPLKAACKRFKENKLKLNTDRNRFIIVIIFVINHVLGQYGNIKFHLW